MNFDVDCLRTFALVVETMSFSQAARGVCRSQSTVSQQIFKLEQQVGKRLLARRKGRVIELTPAGGTLLQFARQILRLNDEAYSSMSDEALTGFVRLGVPLDFFGRDFTTWLAGFKNLHPKVGIEVESNQSENLLKRSARGEFDLAFFKQEAGAGHGTVALSEQLVWVAGPNHNPSRERSLPMVLFPEGCAYRRLGIAALRAGNVPWHISFVSPSFDCLRTAVAEGLGVTVLARTLVAAPMRIVPHQCRMPSLPAVELVYNAGRSNATRVVTEMAHYLVDCLASARPSASGPASTREPAGLRNDPARRGGKGAPAGVPASRQRN